MFDLDGIRSHVNHSYQIKGEGCDNGLPDEGTLKIQVHLQPVQRQGGSKKPASAHTSMRTCKIHEEKDTGFSLIYAQPTVCCQFCGNINFLQLTLKGDFCLEIKQ